ncbi:SDR family oxidoreductase [Candidatus Parcubacteria bacterium]|nr:MAG: SDR family oxidoreductase [Candidatus Parcubacteria bacterium]
MQVFLVTGGAGFIGSYICGKLLEQNKKVYCIDNFLTSSRSNIFPLLENPNFVFINHDLSKSLPEIDEKIDGIFHFASPASPNKKSARSYINYPIETLLVNSCGTNNLLDLAMKNNGRFVYASSSEIYGDPEVSPQVETYFGHVNPNGVRSCYDEAKRFGEAITMSYFRKHNVDTRIIRIFNTYGPRMQKDDGRVVTNFINQALNGEPITVYGKGQQTRSFCYVDDLVSGVLRIMGNNDIKGEVINLGNPEEYKIIDIATKIKELTRTNSEIIYEELPEDDPKRRRPDISKAKRLLGFEPKLDLEKGLQKTIEYFRQEKS